MEDAHQRAEEHIKFELLGEKFTVKSDVPKEYFLNLVQNLNQKVQQIKEKYPQMSNMKVLVFSALDFADELYQRGKKAVESETIKRISYLSDSLASVLREE